MKVQRLKTHVLLFSIALLCALFMPNTFADGPVTTYVTFDTQGELIRPSGYREWVYIGTPLTPNDMNNGKAVFPEFHNVYIDPDSWAGWKMTGEFPDGTLIVKELVSVGSKCGIDKVYR